MCTVHGLRYGEYVGLFAVTAIGKDRPGIVAGVSRVLFELGCNIEDSQMTILRGHFAMMLLIKSPDESGWQDIERKLTPVRDRLELEELVVRPVAELAPGDPPVSHALSVYGVDHPGIVADVAAKLAELGVNINDMSTRLVDGDEEQIYVMILELTLPSGLTEESLSSELDRVASGLKVDISLQSRSADVL